MIGVPTAVQRHAILHAHSKNLPLAQYVNLAHLAEITLGYVGADLASLCREASFLALKRNGLKAMSVNEESEKTLPQDQGSLV